MTRRPCWTALAAVFATLLFSGGAYANVISPFVYFWPGVVSINVVYAFPASLLAAFLEKPFIHRAGVSAHPLAASLQANLITTIAGLVLIPIGYPALFTFGLLWCMVAFSVSCVVELWYLRRATGVNVDRRWVIAGNGFSAAMLMSLPPLAYALGQYDYRFWWIMKSHDGWLAWSAFAASAASFAIGCMWSIRSVGPTPGAVDGCDAGSEGRLGTSAESGCGSFHPTSRVHEDSSTSGGENFG